MLKNNNSWWSSTSTNMNKRKTLWWSKSDSGGSSSQIEQEQQIRPTSLVIVHCGPSTTSTTITTPTNTTVLRPSCSPPPPPPKSPPPPPPKSPATSSYGTANDEDQDDNSIILFEEPITSDGGDLLQGILDIIEKQNNNTTATTTVIKTTPPENNNKTEEISNNNAPPTISNIQENIDSLLNDIHLKQDVENIIIPNVPNSTNKLNDIHELNELTNELNDIHELKELTNELNNTGTHDENNVTSNKHEENITKEINNTKEENNELEKNVEELKRTEKAEENIIKCDRKDESIPTTENNKAEEVVNEIKINKTDEAAAVNNDEIIKSPTLAKPEEIEDLDDSDIALPIIVRDNEDDNMTLDDAADLTLDESASISSNNNNININLKEKLNEDEYFELARTSHYESVEFKRRPNASLISKRRIQALNAPRLGGAVKNGISKAWVTMRVWSTEGARKIGEWARESTILTEDNNSTEVLNTNTETPLRARAISEPINNETYYGESSSSATAQQQSTNQSQPDSSKLVKSRSVLTRSKYYQPLEGQSGFDELRRYMKQGGDFCKELSTILQERAEAEAQYAKILSKLSGKLSKSAKENIGTVSASWQQVALEMEAEGEAHREVSTNLSEKIVKPLRATLESQHRIRKTIETTVDKTGKCLSEWRSAEAKSKKHSFTCARENEKLQDAVQEAHRIGRTGRNGNLSDKEIAKLESKRRKAEESVKKADVEYYTFCIRAERARLEWETAVSRGTQCFQELEDQRLNQLKELVDNYHQSIAQLGPKIVQSGEHLSQSVAECDVARDLNTVASVKAVGQPIPEQLLPDFYPEHMTLAMNRERRRLALAKLLQLIRQDLDRERRAKHGVENLARALQQTPTFGSEDSQQNVSDKLQHMRSMLTYLEAARYKVQGALIEMDGENRSSHPLAPHIQVTRDRQGFQQSILKVPPWVREESLDHMGTNENTDWPDRGTADGNSVQPDSDFDEFSSQASDEKEFVDQHETEEICKNFGNCRALYDYTANLCDELNLRTGDIISVREKQEDGWWLGELNGVVGIFPATYVEEINNKLTE